MLVCLVGGRWQGRRHVHQGTELHQAFSCQPNSSSCKHCPSIYLEIASYLVGHHLRSLFSTIRTWQQNFRGNAPSRLFTKTQTPTAPPTTTGICNELGQAQQVHNAIPRQLLGARLVIAIVVTTCRATFTYLELQIVTIRVRTRRLPATGWGLWRVIVHIDRRTERW